MAYGRRSANYLHAGLNICATTSYDFTRSLNYLVEIMRLIKKKKTLTDVTLRTEEPICATVEVGASIVSVVRAVTR